MMKTYNRRVFLSLSATAAVTVLAGQTQRESAPAANRLGLFINLSKDPDADLRRVAELGFADCEIYSEQFGDDLAMALRQALDRYRIGVTALFTMGPGAQQWDFYEGPRTNGLVPRTWRRQRIERLKEASDWARRCGIPAIETHCGFIPENPNDELYKEAVVAIREVARYCQANGQFFLYHAGAETPITLLRTIQEVGLDNQGIGLDTANGILYGTGHPADALEVYGQHLHTVNAKDGLWPTGPRNLGKEVPLGQGKVDFPRVLRKLRELDYHGSIIIEREISGPEQSEDIKKAKAYLEKLLRS
jgi:L-ribulose-5-phosphate 3-epimerase